MLIAVALGGALALLVAERARLAVERAHAQRIADAAALAAAMAPLDPRGARAAADRAAAAGGGRIIGFEPGVRTRVVVRLRPRRLVLPALLGGDAAGVAVTAAAEAEGDPLAGSVAVPEPYGPLIADAARREGVPAGLLAAQLQIESGFDPRAVSPAGAQGIAQFMPGTWGGVWNPWRAASPFDAPSAIAAQARLMAGLLRSFGGRPDLALAAYNAGPARARQPAATWPAETRAYVPAVLALAGAGLGRARLVR